MSEEELNQFLIRNYNITFPKAYIHFAWVYNNLDSKKKGLQVHHVCPRCCGGDDSPVNLIKITLEHHRKLHKLILLTESLNSEQKDKLTYAYKKMCGK